MSSISLGNLNLLRGTQHKTQLALSVYHPPEIWRARVSGAQTEGDASIVVDVGTVVSTRTPYKHAQILISAVGYGLRDLGETYFKSYAAGTLNVGSHNSSLPDGAYISIRDWIPPTAIHATLSAGDVVSEDGDIAYTAGANGENIKYMPLARMGCPAVAYIDAGTGLATVKFYSSSVAIAAGQTLTGFAWSFRSGTPNTSASAGTAGAPVVVTWNTAGEYYCFLTVTDNPNGITHTRRTPVFVYDAPGGAVQPYTQLEIDNIRGDVERSWSAHIKVHGAATEAEFPSQALCVLSARDWYGDSEISIGGQYTWRENIVLTGYIRTGSTKKNAQYGYVEFDLESSPIDNLEGLAGTLTSTAGTPGGWHELKNQTLNLAAHHILTQHSTLSEIADVHLDLLTYAKNVIDLPESSVLDQLQTNVAMSGRGRVHFSAQGMLYLESDPQLLPTASRAGYTNVFANSPAPNAASMAFADFRDEIDLGTERAEKQVSLIDLAAEDAAAAAIYSLAPAKPWRTGRGERISSIRAADQAEANEIAGLIEGKRNNDFADVVLPLRGNYRIIDTAPAEQVQVTLTAAQNKRGIAWANERCWVKGVSYEYRTGGVFLASLVVEKDAVPSTGITGNYPTTPPEWPPPTFPPVEPPVEPPVGPPIVGAGKGNLLYVSTHKGLAKCEGAYGTDGTDGAPVWTKMNGSGGGALGNVVIRWFNLDPFSIVSDHFESGWAMTDGGLYRVTGLPAAPVWSLQLDNAAVAALTGNDAILNHVFCPSVRQAGRIIVFCSHDLGPHGSAGYAESYCLYSGDYGATWAANTAYYIHNYFATGTIADCQIVPWCSQHLDNTYYAWSKAGSTLYRDQDFPFPARYVFNANPTVLKSTTLPQFHAFQIGEQAYGALGGVEFPYCDPSGAVYSDDKMKYWYGEPYVSGAEVLLRSTAETPVWANVTPAPRPPTSWVGDATMVWTGGGQLAVKPFFDMFNENNIFAMKVSGSYGGAGFPMWTSVDRAATWTHLVAPAPGGRSVGDTPYAFVVPIDHNIVYVTAKCSGAGYAIPMLTTDFGATWTDISLYSGAGDIDTVMGLTTDSDLDDSTIFVDYFRP